jgi:hypothetical protein
MGNKIRIYESEIKRATRRKLMERYIDNVDEAEEMTVYNQDEFNANFDKLDKGTYGVKDDKNQIRSVTVNEEEKWIQKAIEKPGSLRKSMGVGKGQEISKGEINKELSKLKKKDTNPEKEGVQGLNKSELKKYRQLNLAKTLRNLK